MGCKFPKILRFGVEFKLLAQRIDLGAFLLFFGCDRQGNQVAQRIDCHMHFRAIASLVAVVASVGPAVTAALQGAAIEDDGAGLA